MANPASSFRRSRSLCTVFGTAAVATSSLYIGLPTIASFCVPQIHGTHQNKVQSGHLPTDNHFSLLRLGQHRQLTPRKALPEALETAQTFLEQIPDFIQTLGPWGPVCFYGLFVLLECFSLPATPLLLSSGFIFGLQAGCLISLCSLCTAATISFFLARTVLRPQLLKIAEGNEAFQNINKAVKLEGFKIIFLLRLAPLLPFAISNYAYGLSEVGFVDFILATAFGCAPGTCAFVYFATVARSIGSEGAGSPWYVYVGGVLATLMLLKVVAEVAQKAVKDSIEAEKQMMPGQQAVKESVQAEKQLIDA
jgi:uncharacterized membrane protein YdjX (TVP38/TMEM64 family)